jgi:hypothetical protein
MAKAKAAQIPDSPDGYAVNVSTGGVHTRYAGEHAGNAQKTRGTEAVRNLLGDQEPTICAVCFPSDKPEADAE